jgi:hypothetical protein
VRLGVEDLEAHQQRVIAQVAPLGSSGTAPKVLVVAGHAGRWPLACVARGTAPRSATPAGGG